MLSLKNSQDWTENTFFEINDLASYNIHITTPKPAITWNSELSFSFSFVFLGLDENGSLVQLLVLNVDC